MITLAEGRTAYNTLTRSEREVVNLLADGNTVRDVCFKRHTENTTVRHQIKKALEKFDLHSQIQLVSIIWRIRYDDLQKGRSDEPRITNP